MMTMLPVLALAVSATLGEPPKTYELVESAKIWDAGQHNAFTDLIRWRGHWYCTFREADAHVGGDGKLRVLTSDDGQAWTSAALIGEPGIDLRDPKLSITPDGKLMIVAGGSVYDGKKLLGKRPRVMVSENGTDWPKPHPVLAEGEWLWRVTWHDGTAYGVSYNAAAKPPDDGPLKLFKSTDGRAFDRVTLLDVSGRPNETTLRFTPDGEMIALVRREEGDRHGWVGRSRAPYTQWAWQELGQRIGGPNFIRLPNGRYVAVVRLYDKKVRTAVCDFDPVAGTLTERLALPSGGDTSYAGLVWHDKQLWVSYYSSHEGKTNIYLARVRVN